LTLLPRIQITTRRAAPTTMSVHIDLASRIVHDQEQSLALLCPHCLITAHITPSAVPRFEDLQTHKPKYVGLVYRCDACLAPIFLRTSVRAYNADRIELAPQFIEVERPRENFAFTHLPEEIEVLFKEALTCYSSGAFNAFASMCRRAAQAMFADLGEVGRLRLYDELNNVRAMAELDAESFTRIKRIVFGSDSDPRPNPPLLESHSAAVLLEIMKDLLYEAYVRKGKLQQAMMVRRYFVEEKANNLPASTSARTSDKPGAV
jgi:hypothetical protein